MKRDFAEKVAFMICAHFYSAEGPYVGSELPNGQWLYFSDQAVVLREGEARNYVDRDEVLLDSLATEEPSAKKLVGWLKGLFERECGVERLVYGGWVVWATRHDGCVFEVGPGGYRLYRSKQVISRRRPVPRSSA